MQNFTGVSKGLKVNNSLTNQLDPFVPMNGNNVTWYMCGPTVYDVSHVGHARAYLTFDIVRRIMEDYFKYKVFLVMNITDVDDKIIKRTVEKMEQSGQPTDNVDTLGLTREMEALFWTDMRALNVMPPNVVTRVTEYIPEIVAFIQKIIDNGYAYESQGSVYFDTEAFQKSPNHLYGKLCPQMVGNEEALKEGEGSLTDFGAEKRSQRDFALWKKSKPKEPKWESPWGPGRPGWHIECSAMAGDILGSNIDIHSGGIDLRFPHHENEIAQSEACFNCGQWINYFLHAGHLHIEGCKMSKSLKNFITIKEALDTYSADAFRMFYLAHRYDQPLDWSANSLIAAQEEVKRFETFFANMKTYFRKPEEALKANQKWADCEKELHAKYQEATAAVHEALCDNFDTPKVLVTLKELIGHVNRCIATRQAMSDDNTVRTPLLADVANYVTSILKMFGMGGPAKVGIAVEDGSAAGFEERVTPIVETFSKFRDMVRTQAISTKDKEYLQMCDQVRDEMLPDVGIQLEDKKDGTVFKVRDRDELLKEMAQARAAEEEKRMAKQRQKEEQERQKAEKARKKQEQLEKQKKKEQEKKEKAEKAEKEAAAPAPETPSQ
jgi:cysteinyl-tRNA synthetase